MREIVTGVFQIEHNVGARVYVLADESGLLVVDAGMWGDAARIVAEITEAGYDPRSVHTLVLTHYHGDHTGGAPDLVARTGAQVLAHYQEVPLIEQRASYPGVNGALRVYMALGDRWFFRRRPCHVDRGLQDGEVLPIWGGLQVLHVPGHTPGSLALFAPDRGLLLSGDAVLGHHPVTGARGPRLPMRVFTVDETQTRASAARLAALPVRVLCPGHGPVIVGEDVAAQIAALVSGGNR
ncbi:MAG TPA: MBL fold metallo-hydrolase [Chloroflexi bacterium]|nr:MBL fold metallo-hydrolase [Chloroflexota bacterium]